LESSSDSQVGKPTPHRFFEMQDVPNPYEDINDLEAKYEANVDSISAAIEHYHCQRTGKYM